MGEGFGLYRIGDDQGPYIDIANVACGFHASDPNVMRMTVRLAKQHGVRVGAHPSLRDLQGFGRRKMKVARAEAASIIYQLGALQASLDAEGMALNPVKPHGSLYGMEARDEAVANAVCDAALVYGVPLFGMAGTRHETVCRARGLDFVSACHADLDYAGAGGLIITREHPAAEPQAVAARCLRAVQEGKVESVAGTDVPVRAGCVCVHFDTPNAVDIPQTVRAVLASYLDRTG